MRMRKKKWAAGLLQERTDVVVADPVQYTGTWKTLIPCEKLHVEIGSGKGDYWIGMAHKYPSDGWIGIERNTDVAGIAVKKSAGQVLDTMKFIHGDAEDLRLWFAPKEVDVIHLNFSDPWPKKRNTKRRLTSDGFLDQYASVLADDGMIQFKTDNVKLFEYSLVSFSKAGWEFSEVSVDYRREPHEEDVITEYEQSFMDLGQPIYRAVLVKKHEKE
ncbi:MAG: tRNA (guanosine(46)-N7)-methyltransferase TrmB [Erysipelotrichaceae bacterium]|nr:tRNA (guanosine(46)-N7)-methyltransferase TrmB [Erysipelotrichaceae bacterium]